MTREERLKYCQCCTNRKSTTSKGLVCSLTGEQASFENGCKDFDEDQVASKEQFHSDDEKKNSRFSLIERLFIGLMLCVVVAPLLISEISVCFYHDYSIFVRAYLIAGCFGILGAILIHVLHRERRINASKPEQELSESIMMKILQEEGYFPWQTGDKEICFKIKGTTFSFGRCANGFVYGRLYYNLKKEDFWQALLAAQDVELSIVAIKAMIHPNNEILLFSVESLCGDKESFRTFLNRALSILSDSVGRFYDRMKELESDSDCCNASVDDQSKSSSVQSKRTMMS